MVGKRDPLDLPSVKKMNLLDSVKKFLGDESVISTIRNLEKLKAEGKADQLKTEIDSLIQDAKDGGFIVMDEDLTKVLKVLDVMPKGKGGRKAKKVEEKKEAVKEEVKEAEKPKKKRPVLSPAAEEQKKVIQEALTKQAVVEASAPKKRAKRPQIAPAVPKMALPPIPEASPIETKVVVGKSKAVKAIRKPATKKDIKEISKRAVQAIEGQTVNKAVYEAKRSNKVVDVKRVLEEVYTAKGKTGYSLVDATAFLKGGAARRHKDKKDDMYAEL